MAPKRGKGTRQGSDAPEMPANGGGTSDALVGFEEKLWQMADKLRNNMDAAEYKHVVLAERARLEKEIRKNLRGLGYGG